MADVSSAGQVSLLYAFLLSYIIHFIGPRFRTIRAASQQVMSFMQRQVDERRALVQNSKGAELGRDAFTMLVQANEDEAAKYKLSKQELVCMP